MDRNVIIVGGGRVGRHVAEALSEDLYTVTIVELDGEKCENLTGNQASRVIEGDGTDRETLERADPTDADVVAALTNDTRANLTVCEVAKEMNPDVKAMARIARDGEEDHAHLSYVDNTVYPAKAGAEVAVDRMVRE